MRNDPLTMDWRFAMPFGEHVLLECFELNGVNAVLEPRLGLRLPRRFADKPDE